MHRRIRPSLLVLALAGAGACAGSDDRQVPAAVGPTRIEDPRDTFVASRDRATSRPSFVFWLGSTEGAPGVTLSDGARDHLLHLAPMYGVSERVVRRLEATTTHDVGRGAVVAAFRQRVGKVEVAGGDIRVLMRRDRSLVAVSGILLPEPERELGFAFDLTPKEAVGRVLSDTLGSSAPSTAALVDEGPEGLDYQRITARSGNAHFDSPARAKPVLVPKGDTLAPAYEVEVFVEGEAFRGLVSAVDGEVLSLSSLVADAFAYTVWAETAGDKRPFDGPQASFTPHPRGIPDKTDPPFVVPNVIVMDGFNKNRSGTFDPWLPTGATETRGNNVDAYTDLVAPNGFSDGDLRAQVTSSGAFARVYDVTQGPLASSDQQMAAVTQLFYVNNWLHDFFYDSGFDEASGNAQLDNFGRGGAANDPLLAEAQDGYPNNRNNANMSTPADGRSPRMQMYVYDGPLVSQTLSVNGGPTLVTGAAPYAAPTFDVTAKVVVADDGQGASPSDACGPLQNDVVGKIVLVDLGGGCTSATKASRVTEAGAAGMIAADNVVATVPPTLGTTAGFPGPYVPTFSIRQVDGDALRSALGAGEVLARLERQVAPERDGALDNTVVAHEWGHYLHHRLARCTTHQCRAMSEGWGDFNALEMLLREGDDLSGTYGRGIYSGRARRDSGYFGNRRYPYSTDLAKNPLTFRNIMDSVALPPGVPNASNGNASSEVHNAGEVWATTMFEVYVALLRRTHVPARSFSTVQRAMADAVVAGLKVTPPEATYTEQRDAMLAALLASDRADAEAAGRAFAKRGMGVCARSPLAPDSADFAGVVESAAVVDLSIVDVVVDDRIASCDSDGVLDAGETGRVEVVLLNNGSSPAPAEVEVSSPTEGVTFPDGPLARLGEVPAFGRASAFVKIKLSKDKKGVVPVRVDARAPSAPSCSGSVTRQVELRANTDTKKGASTVDDVEAEEPRWTKTGTTASLVWERRASNATHHHWHAENLERTTDAQLVSPLLKVSKSVPFVMTFVHSHDLDTGRPDGTMTDGAVVEISDDLGLTWKDVTTFGPDPYSGVVATTSGTPLAGRRAFVGKNASTPAADSVAIPLGAGLAGKTLRVRFRIVTDGARGAAGWDIDDIGFLGLDESPFSVVVPNESATCQGAPVADAGPDRRVGSGETVTLDAGKSSDPNGDPLSFVWVQTAGPNVDLATSRASTATFRAPTVVGEVPLTFAVSVTDGFSTVSDAVDVVVYPTEAPKSSPTDAAAPPSDGCTCGVHGSEGVPTESLFGGLGFAALMRGMLRRRGRR
jgi:large repetitive protein